MNRWSRCLSTGIAIVGLSADYVFASAVPSQKALPVLPSYAVSMAVPGFAAGNKVMTVDQLIGDPKSNITNKPQTSQTSALGVTSLAAAAPASQPALDPRPLNVAQHVTVDPRSGAAVVFLSLLTLAGEIVVSAQAQRFNL
jgi:hypothetical protein